ncbi:unnamed protein product [Fusarium langsethiae]|nr:unnamed protein product [Fusarium langsethiae]
MTTLDSLLSEIILQIFRDSSPQEFCRLSFTCKILGLIASSCLWSDIELHEKGYHESSAEIAHPPSYRTAPRPYNDSSTCGRQSDISRRAETLFKLLQSLHVRDEARLKQLTGRVRSLCTVIEPSWQFEVNRSANPTSMWSILPYFTRLEALELHGGSNTLNNANNGFRLRDARPLANLKFAKLSAYIPQDVATYVLRSNTSLERLELGMLDDPRSGVVGIDSADNLNFGGREIGGVIPRPLGSFFFDCSPRFRNLKYLHLCQPCNSRGDYFNQINAWSACADSATLESWKNLLAASFQSLETLVLDQRPGAGVEDNEGFSEEEFLNTGSSGLGNKALIDSLGSMLTSESKLPRLSQVYLYGFIVRSHLRRRPSGETPGDTLLHGLARRGVKCEARRGKWCLFDQESGTTSWAKWNGDGCTHIHDEYMGVRWYTVLAKT